MATATNKLLLWIALGIAFWFTAAMIVRFSGEAVFTANNPYLALYFVLTFPLTAVFVVITKTIGKVQDSEILRPIVVITLTAALLDGVALAWFRQLYGQTFEVALFGAAVILWGAGVGLLFAFVLEARSSEMRN